MLIRKSIGVLLFLFLLIASNLSSVNAQSQAENIIENWVKTSQGFEFAEISHGAIAHDNGTNITHISDLAIRLRVNFQQKSQIADIETAKKPKDVEPDNDTSSGQSKLGNIEYLISFCDLTSDGEYYSASLINAAIVKLKFSIFNSGDIDTSSTGILENLSLENIRWAHLPQIVADETKPISKYYPLIDALLDISFDRAGGDKVELVQTMNVPAGKFITHYGRMEVGKTTRGNFSTMFIENGRIETKIEDQSSLDVIPAAVFRMGNIRATDYNYRAVLENIAPGNFNLTRGAYQTFMGELSVDDISVESEDSVFSLERIKIGNIGMRPPPVDILAQADLMFLLAQDNSNDAKTSNGEQAKKLLS